MINKLNFREIGTRIQYYRIQRNMTQEELAELVGTNQKHLSRIEGGYHSVNFNTIAAIAKGLKISIDSLVADFTDSTDESNLKLIMDEIRGMSPNQLEMLKENIATIKKYDK